jgi:hypothetical protein
MRKKLIFGVVFVFVLLIMVGFASAGMGDWFKKITGMAPSDTTVMNVTVGNNAPLIVKVRNDTLGNPAVTESGTTTLQINFTAYDADGASTLNDSSAQGRIKRSGEVTRENVTCAWLEDYDTDYANYSCDVELWYWDSAGTWEINVSIRDNNGAYAANTTTNVSIQEDTCMVMSPVGLAWGAVTVTSTDTGADDDPILINNTCNYDVPISGVNVTGIDLYGENDQNYAIYATNFTVNITDNSEGTPLINGTSQNISLAILTAGNNTINAGDTSSGQEQMYFFIEAINPDLSSQSYSTVNSEEWTIAI